MADAEQTGGKGKNLISGVTIKTIAGKSLVGPGDISADELQVWKNVFDESDAPVLVTDVSASDYFISISTVSPQGLKSNHGILEFRDGFSMTKGPDQLRYLDLSYPVVPHPTIPEGTAPTVLDTVQIGNTYYRLPGSDIAEDQALPTDINFDDNGALILEHDGNEISGQKKAAKFKTVFGNQTIYGSGNIDLYRHVVLVSSAAGATAENRFQALLVVDSSKNTPIDSLTDLKTILGNTFKWPCTGYNSKGYFWQITETAINTTNGTANATSLAGAVFSDTVTTL